MHVYNKITDSHTHTRLIARFDIQDISRYGNRDSMISRTWPEEKGLNSFTQTTAHFVLQLVTGSSVMHINVEIIFFLLCYTHVFLYTHACCIIVAYM